MNMVQLILGAALGYVVSLFLVPARKHPRDSNPASPTKVA